ncbi:hypothetical protein AbraIFM66951_008238, partial [Aspergillus brasiliensis]
MGHWRDIFKTDTERTRHRLHMEQHRLLPAFTDDQVSSTLPSKEVTKVALRLKYQVEQVIPCELDESDIAEEELWDSDLHERRALACEVIAKRIIETEEDQDNLLINVLLKRYSIFIDGGETMPANVIERAVDLHALRVIGSSGYQKCIRYLWNGWFCQQEGNPTNFVPYLERDNPSFAVHFHPDRMRTPLYQNICQIFFSL